MITIVDYIEDIIIDVQKGITIIIDGALKLSLQVYTVFINNIDPALKITPEQLLIIKKLYLDILKNATAIQIFMKDITGKSVSQSISPSGTFTPLFNYIEPIITPPESTTSGVTTSASNIEPMANTTGRLYNLYKINNSDLPMNFDLTKEYNTYPVLAQGECGTCWAYSFGTCFSDAFLVTKLAHTNPLISITNVLNCTPVVEVVNGQSVIKSPHSICNPGGGWPTNVFEVIKDTGLHNAYCKNNYNYNLEISEIQKIIDMDCKTCNNINNNSLYFGSKYINAYYSGTDNNTANPSTFQPRNPDNNFYTLLKLVDLQNMVKRHIMTIGPVMCAVSITRTFMASGQNPIDGKYIYLEDYPYDKSKPNETHNTIVNSSIKSKEDNDYIGGHAMAVVGWENVTVRGRSYPCWIIRNSWGVSWGNKGYIFLPMYPYNKDVQIECWDKNRAPLYISTCCFYDVDKIIFDTITPYPDITCNMLGYGNDETCTNVKGKITPPDPNATMGSIEPKQKLEPAQNFLNKYKVQIIIAVVFILFILYIIL